MTEMARKEAHAGTRGDRGGTPGMARPEIVEPRASYAFTFQDTHWERARIVTFRRQQRHSRRVCEMGAAEGQSCVQVTGCGTGTW